MDNSVKLFDFGLAKELDPYQRIETGLYKMSGGTGSRRFSKSFEFYVQMASRISLLMGILTFALLHNISLLLLAIVAPEVSLSEPYNLSADIYSFAILLYELLSLEKAFGNISAEEHKEDVIKNKQRLPCDKDWPLPVTYLLNACWDPNPLKRPSARDAAKALRQELSACYDSLRAKTEERERRPSY